jgi:hypothetical protein
MAWAVACALLGALTFWMLIAPVWLISSSSRGTDTAPLFQYSIFVDAKPKEQWRPIFREKKGD